MELGTVCTIAENLGGLRLLPDLGATAVPSLGNSAPLLFITSALVQLAAAGAVMLGRLAPARPAVAQA